MAPTARAPLRGRARAAQDPKPPRSGAPSPDPDEAPRPLGRVLSSRQFWDLMERWKVPDAVALELIGFPGKLGASGKRPRFRFTTKQQRTTGYLSEIDTTMRSLGLDGGWLQRRGKQPAPIEQMATQGMSGMADVLRTLSRMALRRALAGPTVASKHDAPS